MGQNQVKPGDIEASQHISKTVSNFKNYINKPEAQKSLFEAVQKLCDSKCKFKVIIHSKKCYICENTIDFENNKSFYMHSCLAIFCRPCIQMMCLEESEEIYDDKIYLVKCPKCKKKIEKPIVDEMLTEEEKSKFLLDAESNQIVHKCLICYRYLRSVIIVDCFHKFCFECLTEYLHNLIISGKVSREELACPECNESLDPMIVQRNVCADDWDKITVFALNSIINKNNDYTSSILVRCPKCSLISEADYTMYIVTCTKCSTKLCIYCLKEHNEFTTCAEYKEWENENNKEGELFQKLVENKEKLHLYKMCPSCKSIIEKNKGCNHMTCTSQLCKGNVHFCFICGILYVNKKPQCTCKLFDNS